MKKIFIVLSIIFISWFVYNIFSRSTPNSTSINPDLIIYWGNGCPHCETVKKYISDNNLHQKLKINLKEVYYNSANQTEMSNLVKSNCPKLEVNGGIGVPFAFNPTSKKCFSGSPSIIDELSSMLK